MGLTNKKSSKTSFNAQLDNLVWVWITKMKWITVISTIATKSLKLLNLFFIRFITKTWNFPRICFCYRKSVLATWILIFIPIKFRYSEAFHSKNSWENYKSLKRQKSHWNFTFSHFPIYLPRFKLNILSQGRDFAGFLLLLWSMKMCWKWREKRKWGSKFSSSFGIQSSLFFMKSETWVYFVRFLSVVVHWRMSEHFSESNSWESSKTQNHWNRK